MEGHVHVGPGALGLGLILDQTLLLGCFKSTVVVREESEKLLPLRNFRHVLVSPNEDAATRALRNFDVVSYKEGDFDDTALQDLIANPQTSLLTVAITREQSYSKYASSGEPQPISGHIAKGLQQRPSTASPLTIISCENAVDNSRLLQLDVVRQLISLGEAEGCSRSRLNQSVFFLNTLVDRICRPGNGGAGGPVVVHAEDYAEWAIESPMPPAPPAIRAIQTAIQAGKSNSVRVVNTRDFEYLCTRKYWMVNGLDIVLACLGATRGYGKVHQSLDDTDIGRGALAFAHAVIHALGRWRAEHSLPPDQFLERTKYAEITLNRIRAGGTEIGVVAKELLADKARTHTWTEKVEHRVMEPLAHFSRIDPAQMRHAPGREAPGQLLVGVLTGIWKHLHRELKIRDK